MWHFRAGGIHLLDGLYDARRHGVPVLAITGHTLHDLLVTLLQQDLDHTGFTSMLSECKQLVMRPAHVLNFVDEALKSRVVHPQPVEPYHSEKHPGMEGIG